MSEIVFVILHYITLDDTIECVNSIREKCEKEKYKIVIVDNASPNNTSRDLQRCYSEANDIELVLLQENLGFAKGNNEGIKIARMKYSPDFIVVMNNDVILLQEDTVKNIRDEYKELKFSVLGPMIYTADGRCNDNPGRNKPMSRIEINDIISENQKSIFLCKWHLWKMYRILEMIKGKIFSVKGSTNDFIDEPKCYLKREINVQLHGCFLCFSKDYFEKFDGFFANTFLYLEEDILFYLTQQKKLITVYTPELKVFHKEDSASKARWKNDKERALRKAKYVLESAVEFRKVFDKECEE